MDEEAVYFKDLFVRCLEEGKTRDQAAWDAKAAYDAVTPENERSYWIDSDQPLPF